MTTKRNSKKITLKRAIKRGETDIKEVTVSEPKDAGALRGLKLMDVSQLDANSMFAYLPRVTEPKLTQQEVESMKASDFTDISMVAADFLA